MNIYGGKQKQRFKNLWEIQRIYSKMEIKTMFGTLVSFGICPVWEPLKA